jgi:conjugative transfer signal peptidase TraF
MSTQELFVMERDGKASKAPVTRTEVESFLGARGLEPGSAAWRAALAGTPVEIDGGRIRFARHAGALTRLHRFTRAIKLIVVAGVSLFVLAGAVYLAGARINTSKSIRLGLYWTTDAPVEKGAYVSFCPPHNDVFDEARRRGYISGGFCEGGYGQLMKRVLAARGDVVTIADNGVTVNGKLLPFSVPRATDPAGRPLPRGQANQYVLGPGELLLMTDVSATSFDGRYFGMIQRSQISDVIRPVYVW